MLELTRQFGIGAQFGGKYFCHDVRVVRLPRHGASCPVAIAVSCSADRQALAQDHAPRACSWSSSRRDPARFLPDVTDEDLDSRRRRPDRPQPADGRDPRRAVQVPGEDPALADRPAGRRPRHRAREDRGAARRRASRCRSTCATTPCTTPAGEDARGVRVRLVRPDHGRPDGLLRGAVPGGRRLAGDAGQGQPVRSRSPTRATRTAASTSARSAARRRGSPRTASSSVEVLEYPELGMEAVWRIEVEDFPAFIVVDDKGNDFFAETPTPTLQIALPAGGGPSLGRAAAARRGQRRWPARADRRRARRRRLPAPPAPGAAATAAPPAGPRPAGTAAAPGRPARPCDRLAPR